VKDLERERSTARGGMLASLCGSAGIAVFLLSEWPEGAGLGISFILCSLIGAGLFAMQLRLLKRAEDGKTAQAYLSVGTSRQPPSIRIRVLLFVSLIAAVVAFLTLIDFDLDKVPWWGYAIVALLMLPGLFIEGRRLRAMTQSGADL
jgi:hypothetical protein